MHLKRWISWLILAPSLILFILFAPPWLFLLFILMLVLLGLGEYYDLSLPGISPKEKRLGMILGLIPPIPSISRIIGVSSRVQLFFSSSCSSGPSSSTKSFRSG